MRDFLRGSRISDTHFPQLRMRTPLYTGCLLLEPRLRFNFEEEDVVVGGGDGDGENGNEFEVLSASEFPGETETLIVIIIG